MEMKKCLRCGEIKSTDEFYKRKDRPGKVRPYCKPCQARQRDEWRKANPEREARRRKAWYQAYYVEGKRRDRPDLSRLQVKAETFRNTCRNRGVPADQDASDYSLVLYRDPCAFCGSYDYVVIDHIVPVEDVNATTWDNMTPLCRSCNTAKGTKSLLVHLAHRNGCWEYRQDFQREAA